MRASSRWRYHTAQPADQTEPDMATYDTVVLLDVKVDLVLKRALKPTIGGRVLREAVEI